jgi:hypothetical protein
MQIRLEGTQVSPQGQTARLTDLRKSQSHKKRTQLTFVAFQDQAICCTFIDFSLFLSSRNPQNSPLRFGTVFNSFALYVVGL